MDAIQAWQVVDGGVIPLGAEARICGGFAVDAQNLHAGGQASTGHFLLQPGANEI
jgi:hypothetical protein